MYLRSVQVTSFGTIDGPVELEFDEGLTLIYGPNETGKSTLMRAIWFAFTRRSSSQAQEIRDIVPETGGTPEVEVVVEIDGDTYSLTKRFAGQQGKTVLRVQRSEGQIETYSGDEADEQLQHALGFGEMNGRARTPNHLGFWPITWVRQGESGMDPGAGLAEEGNIQTLSEVLAETSGQVLAGTDAAEVVEQAREEYKRFFTSSGRETTASGAPLHEARQAEEKAKKRFQELKTQQDNFEQDISTYANAQKERDQLEEKLPKQKAKLAKIQKKQEEIEQLKQQQTSLQREKEIAKQAVEQLKERIKHRKRLRERRQEAEQDVEAATDERNRALDRLDNLEHVKTDLSSRLESRRSSVAESKEAVELVEAHQEVLRLDSALEEVNQKLEQIAKHEKELREKREKLANLSVTDEKLDTLEEGQKELDNARTRLEAAAARVQITAQEDEELTIDGDTTSLSADKMWERRIDRETVIDISSRLSVKVVPGGEDLPALRRRVSKLEDRQASELDAIGASSIQDARRQNRRRAALDSDIRRLEALIETLAPEGKDTLKAQKIEQKAKRSTALELRKKAEERDDLKLPETLEKTKSALKQAKEEFAEAQKELDASDEAVEEHENEISEIRSDIRLAKQKLERAKKDLASYKEEIEDHIEEYGTDDDLHEELEEKETDQSSVEDKIEGMTKQLNARDADHIDSEVERLQDVFDQTKVDLRRKEQEVNRLEGRLGSRDLHGLHERVEKARQRWQESQDDVARWERKASVAKLLYETLEECKEEARATYLAPLQEEVGVLMRRFAAFNDAHVQFGTNNFEMNGLSRPGQGQFSFNQLSGGAKEQLSLFIRIAMAKIVAKEQSHPLFLDEILAETDEERFEAMATVLREISNELQLIVTTCHKSRYRRLGMPITNLNELKRDA